MACPTCDHTLQGLGGRWFWCPRCGTLKCEGGVPEYDQPMLVRRVLKARCWFSSMDLIQGGIDDCLPLDANQLGGNTAFVSGHKELLEAAKELLALMDDVPPDPMPGLAYEENDRVFARYEFDALRVAIAKAEGETP